MHIKWDEKKREKKFFHLSATRKKRLTDVFE